MHLRPIGKLEAKRFIAEHHRHSSVSAMMVIACVGIEEGSDLIGVGTLERPRARMLCDGFTVEASRVCSLGARNACSMLYGALCRTAHGLGYRRIITYTLATEPGSSVRGSGFSQVSEVKPEAWHRRHETEGHQTDLFGHEKYGEAVARVRWERML